MQRRCATRGETQFRLYVRFSRSVATSLGARDEAVDPRTKKGGTIVTLDPVANRLEFKTTASLDEARGINELIPGGAAFDEGTTRRAGAHRRLFARREACRGVSRRLTISLSGRPPRLQIMTRLPTRRGQRQIRLGGRCGARPKLLLHSRAAGQRQEHDRIGGHLRLARGR